MHVGVHVNFRYFHFTLYRIVFHRYILMDPSHFELRKYLSTLLATDNTSNSDGGHKTSIRTAVINVVQIRPKHCVSGVIKTDKNNRTALQL
jgi:hypothetical protein